MRRDWDLIRWILNEVETSGAGYPSLLIGPYQYNGQYYALEIGDRCFEEVYEHILLLGDQNLAEVRNLGRTNEGPIGVAIDRITMSGHDFLETARDENRWNNAMKTVREKGGGAVTIGVLTKILSSLLNQSLGIS